MDGPALYDMLSMGQLRNGWGRWRQAWSNTEAESVTPVNTGSDLGGTRFR